MAIWWVYLQSISDRHIIHGLANIALMLDGEAGRKSFVSTVIKWY
jgi:hypothetical protein